MDNSSEKLSGGKENSRFEQLESRRSEILAQLAELQDSLQSVNEQIEEVSENSDTDIEVTSDLNEQTADTPEEVPAETTDNKEGLEEVDDEINIVNSEESELVSAAELEKQEMLETLQHSLEIEKLHLEETRKAESAAGWGYQTTSENFDRHRDKYDTLVGITDTRVPQFELLEESNNLNAALETLKRTIAEKTEAHVAANSAANESLFQRSDPEMLALGKQLSDLYYSPTAKGLNSYSDESGTQHVYTGLSVPEGMVIREGETLGQVYDRLVNFWQNKKDSTSEARKAAENNVADLEAQIAAL